MIKVKKDYNDIPSILLKEKTRAKLNEIIVLKKATTNISYFYHNKEVVDKLKQIYHNKCAYCETSLTTTRGEIDQFRPKSKVTENKKHLGYYWLVFEWSNLLLLCPVCNRNKKTHFPIENEINRIYEPILSENPTFTKELFLANKSPLIDEAPLLLNPEIDEPKEHLYFTKDGIIHGKTERGTKTIEILRLNRAALIHNRGKIIKDIDNLLQNSLYLYIQSKKGETSIIQYLNFVFDTIKKKSLPESEYSLLGYSMLNNFEDFFVNNLDEDNIKQLLKKAFHYYTTKIELIKEFSEQTYLDKNQILPYAIKQIQIENFRGIQKTGISNLPIDTQWIFFAGNNGAGKTSVLQAIALGLWGQADTLDKQFGNSNIGIELTNKEQTIINNLKSNTNFTKQENFVAYGPSRLTMQSASSDNADIEENSKTYNIFNDDGMLLNIESELSRWSQIDKFKKRYEDTKILLIEILNIKDIKVDEKNYKKLLYQEKEENSKKAYEWLEFKNLASGYRSLIGMIGDMLLRFYKIKVNENKNPKNIEGIVLIDELDLHLHPKWQKRLVEELSSKFKKIQFIVSTHSIIPLLGAPQNSIFIKVNRNIEKGIFLEKIDLNIKTLLPETLLTSELFDFKNITHKDLGDFSTLQTEYTYDELLFNNEVKRRLKKHAEKENYPTDLFE